MRRIVEVAVLVIMPQGIPTVRGTDEDGYEVWKFPCAIALEDEQPKSCAVRILKEQIGITVLTAELLEICRNEEGGYSLHIFQVPIEGEAYRIISKYRNVPQELRFFDACSLPTSRNFLSRHKDHISSSFLFNLSV